MGNLLKMGFAPLKSQAKIRFSRKSNFSSPFKNPFLISFDSMSKEIK